ncbi:hypothetical protein EDD80_105210 [Anseongella ginsenosidimutans]|uniref:TonB family protein n=1 Tax=Anseongella ginsenosidimutans TaxID=496056 RepID=A0A4R3KUB8_9SPHI|nr:hypothetical protein [Anseongella ginsenosidimutans]QEC52991.1 hypothetical protein FRZ59_12035 [Anseongella ginsenosidimutans]TCS87395.1 hypothetical protein EDD80_105210 [Anseongella ginsenosidimutans]
MNRIILSTLLSILCHSSLLAQKDGNLLGFKDGDIQLAKFLIKETNYPGPEVNTDEIHSSVLVMLKFRVTKDGSIDSIQVLNPLPTDEMFVKAAKEGLLSTGGMWSPRSTAETIIIPFVFVLEERERRVIKRDSKYNMNLNDYLARIQAGGESVYAAKILIPVYIHGFWEKPPIH